MRKLGLHEVKEVVKYGLLYGPISLGKKPG